MDTTTLDERIARWLQDSVSMELYYGGPDNTKFINDLIADRESLKKDVRNYKDEFYILSARKDLTRDKLACFIDRANRAGDWAGVEALNVLYALLTRGRYDE